MAVLKTDLDLTTRDIASLTSADALTAFLCRLGYDTSGRTVLTPTSLGLSGDTASAFRSIELLSEDEDRFLRVLFAQPRSLTAKVRNDLIRVLGKSTEDYLVILAANFDTVEFVLLDKKTKEQAGPGGGYKVQVVPKVFSVDRRKPSQQDVRILRQFTWTHQDALDQFDKLRVIFDNARFTGEFFQNWGLFSDYYLCERLKDDAVWRDNPSTVFHRVRELFQAAQNRFLDKPRAEIDQGLLKPVFQLLGFLPAPRTGRDAADDSKPEYVLKDPTGARTLSAAFTYPWGRWLDGPDFQDPDRPDENPGARVVAAIEDGLADWAMVTNGRWWRLYSRQAHARATNFYEVDLVEALNVSGETDPNEAFRYWWLFFRADAYQKTGDGQNCWLDGILQGSREYAKRLGDRLKERVFLDIFPHLAEGFLADRRERLKTKGKPTPDELSDVYEATLTLLYRLLFLLYAESRDMLPVREGPYGEASLKKIKEEIAAAAGIALSDSDGLIEKAYSPKETTLYGRLSILFQAMDQGDPGLNVPTYNGGLFNTSPESSDDRDHRIARFLRDHKVPDRFLARAIDRLARDQDEKTLGLVFIDYKSLEVRHLGSIYEGLLEFKLKVAEDDLTTQTEKNQEKYLPLSQARTRRGRSAEVVVKKGEVYLSNDKADRKASGAYYTPDPIVEYIVGQTVGPILDEKLEALRPEFRKVRKTFENELQKATAYPPQGVSPKDKEKLRSFAIEKTYHTHKDLVERLFDITVLDPAMGSGHFLVEAVDRITDKLLQFLSAFPVNPVTFHLERTRASILESLANQGVTVVRDKLTDINLLKRHVLKRCIYGVDLNPMAVELAKVSLWLDAFTLGAPLSFLDHHLRCGNSLVGATLEDIEKATEGRLFRLDYEPLLRAINYVLLVSKIADATAAEVADSVSQYAQARKSLSGYQIVLDLLLAEHFGMPQAKALVSTGDDLDFSDREKFLASLHGDKEKKLVAEIEALAKQSDRRFFHWEVEFPEVFFGLVEGTTQQIRHKDRIAAGSAGFDAIVGNPPYVRQEAIKPYKVFLKQTFATFDSTNDLYVFFQEQEVRQLRAGGRMGMIVANKWMRAGYGERLRDFIRRVARPLEIIDFGHSPIFPDADTFPCILIVAKRARSLAEKERPAEDESMAACDVPREHWNDRMDLGAFVAPRRHAIPTRLLRKEGWSLEDTRAQTLMEKIRRTGAALGDYCKTELYRGPVSGLNEAFVIDAPTRDEFVREDKRSAELLKPLLRGRDVDRWIPRKSNKYMIFSRRGTRIDQYPPIKRYLSRFRERLEPRPDDWDERDEKWPGRRPGDYKWFELQDPVADDAVVALQGPKIVYQDLAWFSEFSLDSAGVMPNNTVYTIPTRDLALLAVLNSPLVWWFMWRTAQHGKDEVLRLFTDYVVCLPIPDLKGGFADEATTTVNQALKSKELLLAHEAGVIEETGKAFSIPDCDERVLSFLHLQSETFLSRLLKLAGISNPSTKVTNEVMAFHRSKRARQVELLTRQLELEQQLAILVEDAYGLTPEERALLHATRPVRDPIDVLRAKIQGHEGPNGSP